MKTILCLLAVILLASPTTHAADKLELKLHVHIMDVNFKPKGKKLNNKHINRAIIQKEVMPEINKIYEQADISFRLATVDRLKIQKQDYPIIPEGFPSDRVSLKRLVDQAVRDEKRKSDPKRLVPLMMFLQKKDKIPRSEWGTDNLHIYLWPFIGNTSQGVAMRTAFGKSHAFHTAVGTWSNKHNGGGTPERALLTESWNDLDSRITRGSLSRTIAHELGHVIGLKHYACEGACLMGPTHGYKMTPQQIETVRSQATLRLTGLCEPLSECGYRGNFDYWFPEA